VTDRETRRLSFGSVAADYDRYRPAPPPQALDWLVPPGAQAVLDLAAGTGVITRELVRRAAGAQRVIAVEPDERMRAVLATRCPEAEVLAGRGEDIPLPDASVDAVVISAAWHWLDPERAVPEIVRVLRVGGSLGVIWVSRDARVPWVAEFNALARESREADRPRETDGLREADQPRETDGLREADQPRETDGLREADQPRETDRPREAGGRRDGAVAGRRRREVTFPTGTPLSAVEELTVEYSLPRTKEELFGLLGTYSGVITLDPERRAEFAGRVTAFLDRQPWDWVDLPMICRCLRSTRLPG
jgi:SAM-dependent methyltransferase